MSAINPGKWSEGNWLAKLARFGALIGLVAGFANGTWAFAAGTNDASAGAAAGQVPVQTLGVYRPLDKETRAKLVEALKPVAAKYGTNRAPVIINVVAGNYRLILAHEMVQAMKDAGLEAKIGDTQMIMQMPAESALDVSIKGHGSETAFMKDLSDGFIELFPGKISQVEATRWEAGRVEINISGNPVFSSKGVVTFK